MLQLTKQMCGGEGEGGGGDLAPGLICVNRRLETRSVNGGVLLMHNLKCLVSVCGRRQNTAKECRLITDAARSWSVGLTGQVKQGPSGLSASETGLKWVSPYFLHLFLKYTHACHVLFNYVTYSTLFNKITEYPN